jgi:hypothetical protein
MIRRGQVGEAVAVERSSPDRGRGGNGEEYDVNDSESPHEFIGRQRGSGGRSRQVIRLQKKTKAGIPEGNSGSRPTSYFNLE